MTGLSPHLQPENLNAFKNTTGTFLWAGTATSHSEWADQEGQRLGWVPQNPCQLPKTHQGKGAGPGWFLSGARSHSNPSQSLVLALCGMLSSCVLGEGTAQLLLSLKVQSNVFLLKHLQACKESIQHLQEIIVGLNTRKNFLPWFFFFPFGNSYIVPSCTVKGYWWKRDWFSSNPKHLWCSTFISLKLPHKNMRVQDSREICSMIFKNWLISSAPRADITVLVTFLLQQHISVPPFQLSQRTL